MLEQGPHVVVDVTINPIVWPTNSWSIHCSQWIEIEDPKIEDEKGVEEPKDVEMTFGQAHGIQLGPEVQYTAHHPGFGAHVLLYHVVFTFAVLLNVIFIILVGTGNE